MLTNVFLHSTIENTLLPLHYHTGVTLRLMKLMKEVNIMIYFIFQ